jgi:hypothetical protein
MAAYAITSEHYTDWQFGPIRTSLDRRTKEGNEDKEEYLILLSVSRFRDHKNITAVAEITNTVAESATGIEASFQGAVACVVDATASFSTSDPAPYARWFLQDTTLDPIELQGGTFVRETQEWTAQTPEWVEGGWQ